MRRRIFFLIVAISLSSCTMLYRSVRYWTPDINEYKAFPQAKIEAGDDRFHFYEKEKATDWGASPVNVGGSEKLTVDEFLSKTRTTAFLIIRNDTILFEKYYRGYDRSMISTFFSATKSVTSLLVGIAVDEGLIRSVNDPVTDYLPELKTKDPHFQKLAIEHLLNMQAGFRFNESYINPFSDMAQLFYGNNQLGFIEKLKFDHEPGEMYAYNSATTALLGLVLERAVGIPYAAYLEQKIWRPLGMEYNASMSLDDKKHRSAKSYQGLNATAIDLAKIGRLYLEGGMWNGRRIVSKAWIDRSIIPAVVPLEDWKKYKDHQYHWYSDERACYITDSLGAYRFTDSIAAQTFAQTSAFPYYTVRKYNDRRAGDYWVVCNLSPQFYAYGIMTQILYVDPEKKYIMVRLGEDWATGGRYNVVQLANILMRGAPVVEKRW